MCTKEAFRRARTPFSNRLCPFRLRLASRRGGARTGNPEVDGSDPPFLLPGSGTGALRNSHLHNTPWGVATVSIVPAGRQVGARVGRVPVLVERAEVTASVVQGDARHLDWASVVVCIREFGRADSSLFSRKY